MAHKVVLYIQPAYNYETGEVEYAEVLIRNYRGIDTVPGIMRFVHKNSIEDIFDMDILNEVLNVMSKTKNLNYPIGVNICSQSIAKEGMADKIIKMLKKYDINHSSIVIELNECTDFKNDTVQCNINKLREVGIRIALDDFGVESANLCSLMYCNVDILKVDKMFIDRAVGEQKKSQQEILKALIGLCSTLHLYHIVEGVETNKQLDKIQTLGYSVVQGYLYKKPVPFREFMLAS